MLVWGSRKTCLLSFVVFETGSHVALAGLDTRCVAEFQNLSALPRV